MKRTLKIAMPICIVSAMIIVSWFLISQANFAVFEPAGWVALQQKKLLLFALALSLVVVVPVFFLLFWFGWKYREGNAKAVYQPEWDKNNRLEILWWGVPVVIIIILSVITWKTSHELDPYQKIVSANKTIRVEVVALQWKWLFIYPDLNIATVNELAMPVNHPVSFRLSADAPMSGFWVPQLGSQIYSMNGMATQVNLVANKTGTFKGYNTNINGEGYAHMTFDTKSLPEPDFERWVNNAHKSSNVLTMQSLESLIKPSYVDAPVYYHLQDDTIFDAIVMKYMHGNTSETTGKKPSDKHKSEHHMESKTDTKKTEETMHMNHNAQGGM